MRWIPVLLLLSGGSGCLGDLGGELTRERTGFSGRTLDIAGAPLSVPAEKQADMNIKLRGWREVDEARQLVDLGGSTDGNAPKINTIFADRRVPPMARVHRVGVFSGLAHGVEAGAVHLVEFQSRPGEPLGTPASGYNIGEGLAALVLYADEDSLLLKFTREDNNSTGYGIHLLGLAVDPGLLASYRRCVAGGRASMPALASGEVVGRARSTLLVAVRDTGSFMDPRSRKDWYDGSGPVEPPAAAPQAPPAQDPPPQEPAPATPPPGNPPPSPPSQPPAPASTACSSGGVSFKASQAPQACGSLDLTVSAGSPYTWVMAGVGSPASQPGWKGGAVNVSCSGGTCRWTFPKVPVPCGPGPFSFHFRRDSVGDNPALGVEVAACQP